MATEVFDRLPTTREAAEKAAQNIGRPVRDELLVRIDVAALYCCSLCRAERLGIADEAR